MAEYKYSFEYLFRHLLSENDEVSHDEIDNSNVADSSSGNSTKSKEERRPGNANRTIDHSKSVLSSCDYSITPSDDYSPKNVATFLAELGLVDQGNIFRIISLSRFVFLEGIEDEVYSNFERNHIEIFNEVTIFPESVKTSKKGNIAFRFFCIDLSDFGTGIYEAVLFMKIVIKAYAGFPFFVIRLSDGFHFGMRVFQTEPWNNCILSDICTEKITQELLFVDINKDFYSFYSDFFDAIRPEFDLYMDYDIKRERKIGIDYKYIEALSDVGRCYGIDFSYEIERYTNWFEEPEPEGLYSIILDESKNLSQIKSSKVNTIEILFEAEEAEKNAEKTKLTNTAEESGLNESIDDYGKLKEYSDDPEELIKNIKALKGLK